MFRKLAVLFVLWLFCASNCFAAGQWVWEGGAWHAQTNPYVYEGGYQHWKTGSVWESGAWHQYYAAGLIVSANAVDGQSSNSGSDCSGVTTGNGGGVANPSTTVSGGSGSYTYSWAYSSGDTQPLPSSSTAQNPTWSAAVPVFVNYFAFWTVTVTDSVTSAQGQTTISVSLTCND